MWGVNLENANLRDADLGAVNMWQANLNGADLTGANLRYVRLVETQMAGASVSGAAIYGASVWDIKGIPCAQENLIITPADQPQITVDSLEVAQFIYLLLKNEKIRHVIDTITSKVVLILGRFSQERFAVLTRIRDELRTRDYLPVLFDFEKPANQTTVETISTLAHMARFVIADLTDARSVLQELQEIVPRCPSVVIQPLLLAPQAVPGMFDFFRKFSWVLKPHLYRSQKALLASLTRVIAGAEAGVERQRRLPGNGESQTRRNR